jgi:YbbR domain-containing protein
MSSNDNHVATGASRFWPFRHLGLKVVSVGLALLLWLVIAGEEVVERSLRVPVELQQFPAGLELKGDPTDFVDVRVRGASSAVARVSPGDSVAVLDLRGATPGRRLFQLTPEQVRVPFGVDVIQVVPATIAMVFEPSATREVPVVVEVDGEPAPGFVMGTISVDPKSVQVIGPESSVKAATEAVTETISIAGAQGSVAENVTIGFLDPTLRLTAPRRAAVKVEVLPGPRERLVRDQPIYLRNLRDGLSARAVPSSVDVFLRGSREGLGRVKSDDVLAFVDLAGLGAGEYALTVHVDPFPSAGVARVEPAAVKVRIDSVQR